MQLNPKYRYIWLDFETTGLDVTKDEPIQIGLVELDCDGKVIDSFQSLIKPNKKTDELKHIVGFITGLSISDLENAPRREAVLPQIEKFFGENTVVVWHNVGFDMDFLNAYFPGLACEWIIDTYKLSQSLVHYAPSHALEVLIQHLQIKEQKFNDIFLKLNDNQAHDSEKSHDALYDTKESLAMFLFFIDYIQGLEAEYGSLLTIQSQSEWLLPKILHIPTLQHSHTPTIHFSPLTRISPQHTSLEKSKETFTRENQKRYYIGNIDIKDFIKQLAGNKNCILAFQNIQKLDIAKKILNDAGIKNIGFVKEDQTISEEIFKSFLNKGTFTEEEFLFICKYLSHLQKGYGTLDLNNPSDYRIYHTIKDTRAKTKYPIILGTHPGIYAMMEEENIFPDYEIFFFDVERRYKTYNYYLSRPCDLYYTLNLIESFIYKNKVQDQIEQSKRLDGLDGPDRLDRLDGLNDFYNFFQIFIWVLSSETKKIFTKTEAIYIPHDPIIDHGDFYQSTLLRKQIPGYMEKISDSISPEDLQTLDKQIQHIDKIFNGVVNISKKMYNQSDFYFVYAEAQRYTDRKEFVEIFKNNIYFLSNGNKEYPQPSTLNSQRLQPSTTEGVNVLPIPNTPITNNQSTKIPTRNLWRVEQITTHIQNADPSIQNIFIFSPKKEESKKIFEDLCQKDIHKDRLFLVENITGGVGKNVFKATAPGKKVIIGGNSFLLYLYANGITIDEIILFNSKWGSEQSILQDIQRYYPK